MLAGGISEVRPEIIHGQGFTEVVFRRRGMLMRLVGFVAFVAAWLFGFLLGIVLMGVGGDGPAWFFPLWLAGWGLGGLVFLFGLLWNALGVESLVVRADNLTLLRRMLFFNSPVVLPARTISEIRWMADDPTRLVRVNGRRIPQTGIEIVTDSRVVRCAKGLGESDARTVIAELRQRLVIPKRREA